jgi:hypothetical protein
MIFAKQGNLYTRGSTVHAFVKPLKNRLIFDWKIFSLISKTTKCVVKLSDNCRLGANIINYRLFAVIYDTQLLRE